MRRFSIFMTLTLLALLSSAAYIPVTKAQVADDQKQVTHVIDQYFKLKYEGQSTLKLHDFSGMVDNTESSQAFLQSEVEKREIELYQASLFGLRYVQYDYSLDFSAIKFDDAAKEAVVTVIEGHDVVFEATAPVVSSMRNLEHTITLRKAGDTWMIVGDVYEDDLQRFRQVSGLSKGEILERIRVAKETENKGSSTKAQPSNDAPEKVGANPDNGDQPLTGVWHSYNRTAAVQYAHNWAYGRNSAYYNYDNLGGDCTNFASQVIRAGGAPMDSTGSYQWYWYSDASRAPAWTGVDYLYTYLVNNTWTGPVGIVSSVYDMAPGDLAQLDFGGGAPYEHSPVVVSVHSTQYQRSPSNTLIAAHTTDRDNYPLANYVYASVRYIRITGYYD